MSTLTKSLNGLSLMFELNWDRILYVITISLSLLAGLYVGSLGLVTW
ncbi:MAG: hypothetical protein WAO69_17590 [Aestuariivita sp.]